MSMDVYKALVKELGARLEFDNEVQPNSDGLCILDINDTYLSLRYNDYTKIISMYVYVCDVPQDCPSVVLARLLDAQSFFKESHGATFSKAKDSDSVLLHLNIPLQIVNGDTFFNAAQNLLHTAEQFSAEIAQLLEKNSQKSLENTEDISLSQAMNNQYIFG